MTATTASRVAAVPGAVLQVAFGAVARIRPADKPLHPRGSLLPATIRRSGLSRPVGVPWIDEPGEDAVTVRVSRSVGLPHPLPDIHGLAVRVPTDEGHGDLLLATSGSGRLSRFLFVPSWGPSDRSYSSLLPYRTADGPLLLGAEPVAGSALQFDLACASPQGTWRRFARLSVEADAARAADVGLDRTGPDPTVSFDPVLNRLPGLVPYPWVASLREGAYVAARRARAAGAA